MYCRSIFSHKELIGKKRADMHEMLYQKGKNWATDLTGQEKNGAFIIAEDRELDIRFDVEPNYESIKHAILHNASLGL